MRVPIAPPLMPGAYAAPRITSILCVNNDDEKRLNWHDSRVPDSPTASTSQADAPSSPAGLRVHWWSRPSPWWWGLAILVVLTAVAATQLPRISATPAQPRAAATSSMPRLAGPDYTQAMAASRDFVGANLRGARLIGLDLRGKNFTRAKVDGAVLAGSLLNGADFSHADLRGADLRDVCLRGADLTGAAIAGADFTGADVTGVTIASDATSSAIGWDSVPIASHCPGD